jgi:hypothetical protein
VGRARYAAGCAGLADREERLNDEPERLTIKVATGQAVRC